MTKDLLGILTQEQALTDAEGNQTASRSFLHAMTGVIKGTTVSPILVNQYVNATNGYIATCLNNAIVARKAGQMTEAMTELGLAIHPMEDATSPAHIGFQPWSDDESAWHITQHIMKEDVYPDDPSDPNQRAQLIQLEGAVRYAYAIYLGRAPLPAQFFDAQFHLVIPPSFCFAPPS